MDELKKHSILMVDDQQTNIDTLRAILEPDYIMYSANDGPSAIQAAEAYLPDLILLDIVMPQMDGYTVISRLKNSKVTQNIPVIFLTGLDSDREEEKGLDLGAADYIVKPFHLGNVKLRIKKQIETLVLLRSVERLSMIDQLTDLSNRRGFESRLNSEWARALREKAHLSILFIDVDKFKGYNDRFGHQQGDIALKALARVLSETLKRPGDFSARWGGEEFVALLTNTNLEGSINVAEQIRASIEEVKIPSVDDGASHITVSIGIKTLEPGHKSTVEEFIAAADSALYKAKESGRNRVAHS
ncbi:MAG: diguanylate cyclase [Treponema sp.]|nr:diguanylate cyclase [Treponema sp.]